jgi:hypothetical protein
VLEARPSKLRVELEETVEEDREDMDLEIVVFM